MTTVEAVYEHSMLRLLTPLPLADGTPVEVVVVERAASGAVQVADLLVKIAELPVEGDQGEISNRDHDVILCGGKNAS